MKILLLSTALVSFASAAAFAGHANPWANEGTVLLEQYHETNQARSADTPGEDEMNGVMVQNAYGKLVLDAGHEDGEGHHNATASMGTKGGGKGGRHGRAGLRGGRH